MGVRVPGVIQFSRDACRAAWLALVLATVAAPSLAQSKSEPGSETPATTEPSTDSTGEGTILEAPPLPVLPISEAVRIRLQTFLAPDAPFGSGDVNLVRPELTARATWPASDNAVLRISTRLAQSQYRFYGDVWGGGVVPGVGRDPDEVFRDLDLHSAQLGLEFAYRLGYDTDWFAKHEEWAVVSAMYANSRWEDDDFHSGLGAGTAIGVGYEIRDRLRLALGVSVRSPLNDADFDVGPFFSLRWRPTDRFAVRSRELGLQFEYTLTPVFEVFLAAFRSTDRFRLNEREPLGDLSFRDRQVPVGVGFEWKLSNWLHVALEGGAIVDRQIRVHEEDLGTLLERRGDPSGYFELRFEVRL